MRKSRLSEEQIIRILGRVEAGELVKNAYRDIGIPENTYYRCKAKFGGMEVSEARRLKELELENRRLKAVVAELTLDEQALKDVLSRRGLSPRPGARRSRASGVDSECASDAPASLSVSIDRR